MKILMTLTLALFLTACGSGGGGGGAGEPDPTPTTSSCQAAESVRSGIGCHFWAVDLDNEAGTFNDAAAGQFAVAIANVNDFEVRVDVYKNDARWSDPRQEVLVESRTISGNDLVQIDLPQREVDGSMGQNGTYTRNSGSGTFASSHAYRIESNAPVVAHQFQPVVQQFSNDASTLFPRHALGTRYYVLGWPTANPCGPLPGDPLFMEGIPDHGAIAIVGTFENTTVTVVPTHPIKASSGDSGIAIPATPAGGTLQVTVGPYDVVNLESDQPQGSADCVNYPDRNGDFSGTLITSDRPIAVFSSLERAGGLGGATPPDPPGWLGETCCNDHIEEQMLPVEALGSRFVVSRSPVRSDDPGYEEPDLYRILATANGTQVTTSLPAPYDRFTLDAGQYLSFHAYSGFTATSTGGPIMIGQYLIGRDYIPQGGTGDPDFIVFPSTDQHRRQYVFLALTTYQESYMVLAMPESAVVVVDGQAGFDPRCVVRPVGLLGGVPYQQVTCPLDSGIHRVTATEPVGLTVYGYYDAGSYGYSGG